jgi:hypothetical protein
LPKFLTEYGKTEANRLIKEREIYYQNLWIINKCPCTTGGYRGLGA